MRINNNVMALNAHRQLGTNQAGAAKSMEKLSSGFRINRAGDDAAGLAISEKMRGQIRGLKQASRNAQDGISLIQTAEGSLNETHSILQRMKELATQAANDTNTSVDRSEIQKEINQLTSEINRIGNNTEFNTQKLLNGTQAVGSGSPGTPEQPAVAASGDIATNVTITAATPGVAGNVNVEIVSGPGSTPMATLASGTLTITLDSGNTMNVAAINAALGAGGVTEYTVSGSGTVSGNETLTLSNGADLVPATPGTPASGGLSLQIGANQGQQFTVEINDMRAAALGIAGTAQATAAGVGSEVVVGAVFTNTGAGDMTGTDYTTVGEQALDVSDATKASAAVKVIDQAIESVSAERSKLGSAQNRLEHTISNLGTSAENLQAAESRIRDLDMAEEIMTFTKNNILQQAATAMLAQANMAPQSVLQLLG